MDFKRIIVAAIAMMAMGHVQAVLIEFGGTVTDIDDNNGLLVQTFGDQFAAAEDDLVTGLISLSGQIIPFRLSHFHGTTYYIDPRAERSFNLTINQHNLVFKSQYILIGNDRPCHTGSTPCDTADYWIVGANLSGVLIQLVYIIRDGEWLDDEQFFMIDSYPSNYEEVFVRAYQDSFPNPPILLTATVDSEFVSLPVPSTVALFGIGLVLFGLGLVSRKAKRAA